MFERAIYADWAATAPLHPAAVRVLSGFLTDPRPANPSSLHGFGRDAAKLLTDAREKMAHAAGWKPEEVTFTGGGTEGAVLAVHSMAVLGAENGRRRIVLSPFEHPAVREAVWALVESEAARGRFTLEECLARPDGTVDLDDFAKRMGPDVAFCAVTAVQNETGVIQPVRECAALAHGVGAYLLTDGVQAAGHISLRFGCEEDTALPDAVFLSGHKFGGPAGTGALLHRIPLSPLQKGGGQERGLRGGTENVPGIAAMAAAAAAWGDALENGSGMSLAEMAACQEQWEKTFLDRIPHAKIAGAEAERIPGVSFVVFPESSVFFGIEGENLVLSCDMAGLAISAGSACHSGAREPSRTLLAMGIAPEDAKSGVRLSFGFGTTAGEMEEAYRIFEETVVFLLENRRKKVKMPDTL